MRARLLLAAVALAGLGLAAPADARPAGKRARATKATPAKPAREARGAAARISIGRAGELRPTADVIGRRDEPLTDEERTARDIEKLLRGPLRAGITGLYVADARTGQPLFAVNADAPLNPASNVKMISTATALDLLGPEFRYPTRLLGPTPVGATVAGDVYLLGSYDPTLTRDDLDDIAAAVAARGVTRIDGDITVGADRTRDGIWSAMVPVQVTAGAPGAPVIATLPHGADHVSVVVTATTGKARPGKAKKGRKRSRARLTYHTEVTRSAAGVPRITLTIGGTLPAGASVMYPLWTKERTATAVYALRAALRAHGVEVTGDMQLQDLGAFIGDAVAAGGLPIELGRHESQRLADIVKRINKRSINWLADRVVMTATALARHAEPSMEAAVDAMYAWLDRQARVPRRDLVLDTGSGLSYRTRITPADLVAVVRAAGGYGDHAAPPELASAWLDSLAIARRDGTLRHRARNIDIRTQLRGKTGTLSTVIALSGVIELDPERPLAFALVTNTPGRLSKPRVRAAHDQLVGALCQYLARTTRTLTPVPLEPPIPATTPVPDSEGADDHEPDETSPAEALDAEAASGAVSRAPAAPADGALAAVAP